MFHTLFFMKKYLVILFQIITLFIGLGALAFLLMEPLTEWVNQGVPIFDVYFWDIFLICVYIASIPFFLILKEFYTILNSKRNNNAESINIVPSLRKVKYYSLLSILFVFFGEMYIFQNESDDRAGGVFMGLLAFSLFTIIFLVARHVEKKLSR